MSPEVFYGKNGCHHPHKSRYASINRTKALQDKTYPQAAYIRQFQIRTCSPRLTLITAKRTIPMNSNTAAKITVWFLIFSLFSAMPQESFPKLLIKYTNIPAIKGNKTKIIKPASNFYLPCFITCFQHPVEKDVNNFIMGPEHSPK